MNPFATVIGPALIPFANSFPAVGPTVIFSDIVVGLVLIILSVPREGPPPATGDQPADPVPSSALYISAESSEVLSKFNE